MVKRDWGDTFTGAAGEYHDYDFYNDMYLDILENPLVSDLGFAGYDAVDIGKLYFEATDFINYATDTYSFNIADTSEFEISATQIDFKGNNLVNVGTIGTGTYTLTIDETKSISDKQDNLTFGIADTNSMVVDDADAADNDYAKFTATGIEGRSYAEVKTDLSLDAVENTALSTWGGTTNITTLGTIGAGTWEADVIDHERGGLEADISAYDGLIKLSAGATSNVSIGISDDNIVEIDDADAAALDYARFTANGLEGRSYSEVVSDLEVLPLSGGMLTGGLAFESDADFKIFDDSGIHKLSWDSGDWIGYNTSTDEFSVNIGGNKEWYFTQYGLNCNENAITNMEYLRGRTTGNLRYYARGTYANEFLTRNLADNGDISRFEITGGADIADVKVLNSNLKVGDSTDYLQVSDSGVVSLHGAAECELTLRPSLETGPIFLFSVPTVGTVGAVSYYSLPIWNSDNEQLFFKQTVPGRWDGDSDLTFRLYVMLGGAEDVDDTFKFQFSWSHCQEEGTMSSSVSDDVEVQQAVLTDRTAEYSCYRLEFTINYDVDGAGNEVKVGETLFGRLRRIASTGTAVSNEIRVNNWDMTYNINKFAKGCGS